MTYQHTVKIDVQAVGSPLVKSNAYSASMLTALDETVPANGSTTFSNFDVDVSEVESLFMLSDTDVVVKVNDDGSPDATINLVADKPLIWQNDGYYSNPLGVVDVTSLKVTTPAGDDVAFRCEVLQNGIP